MKWLYLCVNLASISIPFIYSFNKRIRFDRQWRSVWPAIFITGFLFLVWDAIFTKMGVWGFDARYISGWHIFNLPIEECLFFICIPYACLFTYEALFYFVRVPDARLSKWITWPLVVMLGSLCLTHLDHWYTATALGLCALMLAWHEWILKSPYLARFYVAYGVILIPFFIVNGILTGSWIVDQVVWYNDAENLGIRMGTIPVEDTFYGMALILMNVWIYEFLRRRN